MLKLIGLSVSLTIIAIEAIFLLCMHLSSQDASLFIPVYNLHYTLFYTSLTLILIWGLYSFIIKRKWRALSVFTIAYSAMVIFLALTIMLAGEDYLLGAPYSVSEIETEQHGRLMLSRSDHRSGVTYQLWRKDEQHFSPMMWRPMSIQPLSALSYQFAGKEMLVRKGDILAIKRQSIWTDCYRLSTLKSCHLFRTILSLPETEADWIRRSHVIQSLLDEQL